MALMIKNKIMAISDRCGILMECIQNAGQANLESTVESKVKQNTEEMRVFFVDNLQVILA
jgi:hypothetical protein